MTVTQQETGQITGTKDKDYNIIWFTEQCLSNVLRLEIYAAKIANSLGASKRGGRKSGSGSSSRSNSRQGGTSAQKKAAGRKGGKAAAKLS